METYGLYFLSKGSLVFPLLRETFGKIIHTAWRYIMDAGIDFPRKGTWLGHFEGKFGGTSRS